MCIRDRFKAELKYLLEEYTGRPSRLYYAEKMTKDLGGARIYLKREDLNHTGSHKINNALGQVLLAKKMGKTRVIAETGAGQHGVATATAAALLGLECEVYMGKEMCIRDRGSPLQRKDSSLSWGWHFIKYRSFMNHRRSWAELRSAWPV